MNYRLLDSTQFGFRKTVKLARLDSGKLAFLIDRKSRFIMKDTKALLEKIAALQEFGEDAFALVISGSICSKSKASLEESGVEVIEKRGFHLFS